VEFAGARRYWLIWAAVLPIAVWAAIRALGVHGGFPLIPLLAYTPYVAVAAPIATTAALALRNWAAGTVSALASVLLLAAVLPRALGSSESLQPGEEELRVLSANVHHGTAGPQALVGLVKELNVDVLSVQELTPSFSRELDAAHIRRLLPNAVLSVRRGAAGGGLYSRLPLRKIPAPPPVPFRMPRGMVRMESGRRVRFVVVHPYPPKGTNVDLWRDGLESLPADRQSGPPWVLAGDFNSTLDFPELRDLLDTGYRDAGEITGEGLEPTWPQGKILPPPVTIDHVLADPRVSIVGYGVESLPGSDHRAVFAALGLRVP
jgi:endonuclease/exonuclease/phosphatase family metal-dependent hydrolase